MYEPLPGVRAGVQERKKDLEKCRNMSFRHFNCIINFVAGIKDVMSEI